MKDRSLLLTIAILGGTGREGKGLAYRWAKAGYRIIIGSRTLEKAIRTAQEISSLLEGNAVITGMDNLAAADNADIVVLTVPYTAHCDTLTSVKTHLRGKILIDVTVPLVPPHVTTVQMPPAGSATQEARQILGDEVEVVAAFQNISYEHLLKDDPVDCDILVCGTSQQARQEVLRLVEAAGLTGWDAGPIENAVVIEGLTSILIGLNKQFKTSDIGIRLTGLPRKNS